MATVTNETGLYFTLLQKSTESLASMILDNQIALDYLLADWGVGECLCTGQYIATEESTESY